MAGELFEVLRRRTGGESDLFPPHLLRGTNLNLLGLSVTVNEADGDWEVWRLGQHMGWMCNT